ncbi:MAG: sulfatase-like hydrolase/transferase [Sedimentisphaerales bacterium]|nr:sulfatase-like hydrolase/transferase [Sedimentisphaerales bacterium]
MSDNNNVTFVMKRKIIIISVMALILAGLGYWYLSGRSVNSIQNVILISIDTCRSDYLSCYGYARETTPNIDAVAGEGIRFENVFSPVPLTLPAHSSMLTGTIPPYHGVHDNNGYRLDQSNVTLAEILKEQGFTTGAVIASFILNRQFGISQGFDHYNDTFEEDISKDGRFSERRGAEVTRFANGWLAAYSSKPFFLFLHYYDPHLRYESPEPYRSRFFEKSPFKMAELKSLYAGEVAYTDYCIGQVITRLRELNLYDNTLLIITSDHGEMLGEHGEEEHGYFIYQGAVKVPLIMRIPGHTEPRVIDTPVGLVDIVPTVCGLLGIDYPQEISGIDLNRNVLTRKEAADEERVLYSESLLPTYYNANTLLAVVSGDWKYIQTTRPELYNWRQDGQEQHNLIDEQGPRARIMQDRLREILESQAGRNGSDSQFELNDEARKRLESLGYVADGSVDSRSFEFDQSRHDPKDYIECNVKRSEVAILYNEGREEKVLEICRELVKKYPQVPFVNRYLGKIFFKRKQYQQALAYFTVLVEYEPENIKLHTQIASAYMETGHPEEAGDHWQEALRLNPNQPELYNLLAESYYLQAEYQKAIDNWKMALSYKSDWIQVLYNLAWIKATHPREDIRDPDMALRYALQACELTRFSNPLTLNALAAAYAATGRFPQAVETAQKAEQIYQAQKADDLVEKIREKMELYKAGQPYIDKP